MVSAAVPDVEWRAQPRQPRLLGLSQAPPGVWVAPAQAVRAQLLFGRCFGGQVYVATTPLPLGNWPYQIAYGWGALVKAALVVRSCLR